jgi:hypothetical protein
MIATASSIVLTPRVTIATRLPSRSTWTRSASSKMGGMSWLQDHRQPSLQDALDQLEHVARLLDAERGGRLVHAHDAPAPSRGTRDATPWRWLPERRLDREHD